MSAHGSALAVVIALATGLIAPGERPDIATLGNLTADGERWWRMSPDPANPVACATCHHNPAEARGWAASFPKFRPLPPPHGRVMTLLQANAEAVRRHYRLADPRPAATAITAYLAAPGAGLPRSPGIASGQPVFPARLRLLTQSVARGAELYAERCARCHEVVTIAPAVARATSPEDFLERHDTTRGPIAWESQAMADLIGYLVSAPDRPRKEAP